MDALQFWGWVGIGAGVVLTVLAVWTWVVVHQAATEARNYFARENQRHRTARDLRFDHNREAVRQ